MGEVYKARDVRLGRDVGVKVMPASFAADCRNGSKASGRGHKTTPPSTETRSFRRNHSAVTIPELPPPECGTKVCSRKQPRHTATGPKPNIAVTRGNLSQLDAVYSLPGRRSFTSNTLHRSVSTQANRAGGMGAVQGTCNIMAYRGPWLG
jgi:hypothetical protein